MGNTMHLLEQVSLQGLDLAPSQVWGAVRIVPLLRRNARYDLRLDRRDYRDDLTIVSLSGRPPDRGAKYISYVPHGLVLSWTDDGSPVAAYGAYLGQLDGKRIKGGPISVRLLSHMVRREDDRRLRFLPLHLSMEGFLSLFFSGPAIAWREYSRRFRTRGFQWRWETAVPGNALPDLGDALRVFEIHEHQVGVLVFVAEALASAFVVPTPEDYRGLRASLLEDFYGELLYQYGCLYKTVLPFEIAVPADSIENLPALREAVNGMRADWAAFQSVMADNLLSRALTVRGLYSAGPFTLQRFMTDLHPAEENHIGEAIVRDNGDVEYLKTFRLSAAQTRRAYLLSRLAAHQWDIKATAADQGCAPDELVHRLERAGFGYILNEQVRRQARKYNLDSQPP
jgi:hypothetical protein